MAQTTALSGAEGAGAPAVCPRCRMCTMPLGWATAVHSQGDRVCTLCRAPAPVAPRDPGELSRHIERIRRAGRGRRFDVVVGLSGGRDSSYLAYLLVHRHNLRCLGAYYRTPFTQDLTDANVHRVAGRLQIPLVELPVSRPRHLAAARSFFRLWCADPRPEYAALCCAGCKFLNSAVFEVARRQKIGAVVFGGNPYESIPFLPTFRPTDQTAAAEGIGTQLRKAITIAFKGLRVAWRCPPDLLGMALQAAVLYLNPHSVFLRIRYRQIIRMDYFMHADWDEAECVDTIREHLGWMPPPDGVETWKADCDFAALKNYMFTAINGATYNDALYSNLVRAGKMTDREALARIRAGAGLSSECITRCMTVMGLPMSLIDRRILDRARDA